VQQAHHRRYGKKQAGYAESLESDKGWMDLSWYLATGKRVALNSTFDRLLVTFEKESWNVLLGQQRINWGQTLVWNPNDIFNTYSFFDFDYVERPVCDAFHSSPNTLLQQTRQPPAICRYGWGL
jgi:hypothetical protein